VIVQPKDYQRWLDPENEDVADILATPPAEGMIALPGQPAGQQPEER
jgi:putative SOS response-associated peptidase YedK